MSLRDFIVDWVWQLPQNLCGIVWKSISKGNRIEKIENTDSRSIGAEVYLQRNRGGVTLGKYIFINQDYTDKYMVIKHECGHVKQSLILGPLYLIVIGIPSIIHAWLNNFIRCCYKDGKWNYHHFYTEKWADKLMGVQR